MPVAVTAIRTLKSVFALAVFALVALWAFEAAAVPSFAVQTGLPCQACHLGGFGPQLTTMGRRFKMEGYTLSNGKAVVPLSVMAVASYIRTQKDQASPPAPHYGVNDNVTLDEASLFLAGRLSSHFGGLAQLTYDGVGRTWSWDQLDLRAVTHASFGKTPVLLGLSLNNNPGVQDPWNTLPAWGFPYTSSDLAPSPGAAALLDGGLGQNSLGFTAYAWIDQRFYVEAGGYRSVGERTLQRLGADPFSPGAIHGVAPYARLAWQETVGPGTVEAGAFLLRADIFPGRDRTTGESDRFTDWGFDGSYVATRRNGDVITLNGRVLREDSRLTASCRLAGLPENCGKDRLTETHADASYYWRNRTGATLSIFDVRGPSNPFLFPDNRTFRPDSAGLTLQVDHTFYGNHHSPFGPRFNARVGAQYTLYTRFDGARRNFDGAGAAAADNDTFRLFAWLAY